MYQLVIEHQGRRVFEEKFQQLKNAGVVVVDCIFKKRDADVITIVKEGRKTPSFFLAKKREDWLTFEGTSRKLGISPGLLVEIELPEIAPRDTWSTDFSEESKRIAKEILAAAYAS